MPLKAKIGQNVTENCGILKALNFHSNRSLSIQHEKQKALECLGYNISGISGLDGSELMNDDHISGADRKNVSYSSASVTSFPIVGKPVDVHPVSHCVDNSHCIDIKNNHTGRPIESIKESSLAFAIFSYKADLSEISSLRDHCGGASSVKDEPSESEEQVESPLRRAAKPMVVGQICNVKNCAESVKPDTKINGGVEAAAVKCSDQKEHLQSQPVNCSDELDTLDDEARVCDICGDAGREELLAICSMCSDGAEHTYCMQVKLDKIPEGDWMCEECKLNEETKKQKQYKFEKASTVSKGSSSHEIRKNSGNSYFLKSKNGLELDIRSSGVDKSRTRHLSSSPHFTPKRPARDLESLAVSKRRALETSVGSSGASIPCSKNQHPFFTFQSSGEEKIKPAAEVTSFSHQCTDNTVENSCLPGMAGDKSVILEPQPLRSRGSLYKSKSFNIAESKVEVPLPKEGGAQKLAIGNATICSNEDRIAKMGKSMSFSNVSSDHSSATDSGIKTLPCKFSHDKDLKRLGREKELNSCRRKSAFKLHNRSVSSPRAGSVVSKSTTDNDMSHGETSFSFSPGSNYRLKAVQGYRKSNDSSKQASHLAHTCLKYPNEELNKVVKDVGQHVDHSTEMKFAIKASDSHATFPSDERTYLRDLSTFASAAAIHYQISVVPELEYIWKGGFEMRSKILPRYCDGIQAHLSTCASPKVLEAVHKLPEKILLEEVSRISAWPSQFLRNNATEDNIALYFFAEDLDSYGKIYKSLLECMIKNDLVLRGNFDGVELLIFSSNLLPEKSQRWNKLLFLWGVFRGRRVNFSEDMPSSGKTCIPDLNVVPADQDLSIPAVPGSHSMHSSGRLSISLSASGISYNAQQTSNCISSLEFPAVTSGRMAGISKSRVSYSGQKFSGLQKNFEEQPSRVVTTMKSEQLSRDARDTDTSLRDQRYSQKIAEMYLKSCLQASRGYNIDNVRIVEEHKCKRMKNSSYEGNECNSSRGIEFSGDRSLFGVNRTGQSVSSANSSSSGTGVCVKFTQFQALSSDCEDLLESGFPNLEFSLGTDKKSAKWRVVPRPGITGYEYGQDKLPHSATIKALGNDEFPSLLSLSLALPCYDNE